MSSNGWIKLHRKISEKGYYQRSQYVHLWVHLLLNANHKPKEYMTNGTIIMIKEGQLVTGRKQLALATGIPESTIEDILKVFESEHQIQQQKTTKYRLITVLNWKEHQDSDSKATAKQQQADTNKNDKNDKKILSAPRIVEYTVEKNREDGEREYVNDASLLDYATDLWEPINPEEYEGWKRNKTQRKAIDQLISQEGMERYEKYLDLLTKSNGMAFVVGIDRPSILIKTRARLRNDLQKQASKITTKGRGIEL